VYTLVRRVLRLFFQRPTITGIERVDPSLPSIFTANHEGSYGPIILMLYLPFRLYPWVTHELTAVTTSPAYIRKDFIEPELRIRGPVALMLSWIIGYFAVHIMKIAGGIPVYKHSKRILQTIEKSVSHVQAGHMIIIFPEIPGSDAHLGVHEFDTGFLKLAKKYHDETGNILPIYPISVNREKRHVVISPPVFLTAAGSYAVRKEEMIENIVERVYDGLQLTGARGTQGPHTTQR